MGSTINLMHLTHNDGTLVVINWNNVEMYSESHEMRDMTRIELVSGKSVIIQESPEKIDKLLEQFNEV